MNRNLYPGRLAGTCIVIVLLGALLAGCTAGSTSEAADVEQDTVNAVVTIGMLADLVRIIGGDHVMVVQLMGAGVDPHLYKATESDVSKLLAADMIFYNGLFLESRMEDIFEEMSNDKVTVAASDVAISPAERLASVQYDDQFDPHVWMDVKLWRKVAETVRDELIDFDPENSDAYRANADAYLAEMDELEEWVREQIASIPEERQVLVTAHDAFHYFGRGYDFEVFAPQGISTESEAGVEDIRRMIDIVVERKLPAIFIESSVPPDIVEAIVEGARARGHEVSIGGELFSDAMGDEGTPEGTYLGMIRHNITTITRALNGS